MTQDERTSATETILTAWEYEGNTASVEAQATELGVMMDNEIEVELARVINDLGWSE